MGTKEPKSKKAKVTKKEEEEENEEEEEEEEFVDDDDDDDNDDDEEEEDDEEEDKKAATVGTKKNEDGEAYFELSDMRRLVVRKFKGATLIDIREVSATLFDVHENYTSAYTFLTIILLSYLIF